MTTDLVRRLERLKSSSVEDFRPRWAINRAADPHVLAQLVLAHCRQDLGLPGGMSVCFCDTAGSWGVVFEASPRILHLSKRLRDEPHLQRQLIESVAHEARHAAFIMSGRTVYDLHAERVATDYGKHIAATWRHTP